MQIDEECELDGSLAEIAESGELSELPSSITRAEIRIAQRSDLCCKELIDKLLEDDSIVSETMDGIMVKGSQVENRRTVIVMD